MAMLNYQRVLEDYELYIYIYIIGYIKYIIWTIIIHS